MLRKLITGILSVIMIMAIMLVGVPLQASAQENPVALKSIIEPESSGYTISEQLNLHFTLSNNSDMTLSVLKWNTPLEGLNHDMFLVEKDGSPVPYLGRLVKRGTPQDDDYLTLKPGEAVSAVVDVSEGYGLYESGNYSVTLKTSLLDMGSEQPDLLAAKAKTLGLMPKGELDSNTVTLKLLEDRNKPTPGGLSKAVSELDPKLAKQPPIFSGGCSTSEQTSLNQALTKAEDISEVAFFDLDNTPANLRSNAQRYKTWFGAYTQTRYDKVKNNFDKIEDALDNKTITFDCSCNNSWYAYVYPTQPYKIYLCNAFWSAPLTGTDSKAGVIVHETSHFNVVAATDDHVYGQSGSKQLAINDPAKAIENADSYEYFAENTPPLSMPTAVSACSLCYTCGGHWPNYSGTIGKITPASSYAPKERGSSCSGSLQYKSDTNPYICCQ